MLDIHQVAQLLGSTEIFAKLEDKHLEIIANACKMVRFEERAKIVTQGEMGQELFIVASGDVAVVQEDKLLGTEYTLVKLGRKECFGEASLLAEAPRSATVKAVTETICVVLAKRSFDSVLDQIPQVGLAISRYLAARLHRQSQTTRFRFVSSDELVFDPELYATFPKELLLQVKAIPLSLNGGSLAVALTSPNRASAITALREAAPALAIEALACSQDDYDVFIRRNKLNKQPVAVEMSQKSLDHPIKLESGEILDGPLAKVLGEAVGRGSIDVLVQPDSHRVQVCNPREEGLEILARLDKESDGGVLLSQIGELFFTAPGLPESVTRKITWGDESRSLQVSSIPTVHGPRFGFRFQGATDRLPLLSELLPLAALRDKILKDLTSPGQMTVLVGAPRTGRTSVSYAFLKNLLKDRGQTNLVSIEKRPFASLDGLVQVKADKCSEALLETVLLQAPALLFCDDVELSTLPSLLAAADLGSSILATLTSSQPFADLRSLSSQGDTSGSNLEPLGLLVEQKLLPKPCPFCRKESVPSQSVQTQLIRAGLAESGQFYFQGEGCRKCRGTGLLGKTPILETLTLSPLIRELIAAGRPKEAIRKSALSSGLLIPYHASAKTLIKQGELNATTALRVFGGVR